MSIPPVSIECILSPSSDCLADSWRYYLREQGTATWHALGSSESTRVVFDGLPRDGLWEVAVAPVVAGIEADPDVWTIVPWKPDADDMGAPDAVGGFRAAQSDTMILLAWTAVDSVGLDHYEIRKGSSWDDAVVIGLPPASATSFVTGVWAAGTNTFHIAAVNQHGAYSTSTTSAACDVQGSDYEPVQGTVTEAPGFTGTKTTTEVSSSKLQITAAPATIAAATGTIANATWPVGLPHYGSGTYDSAWVDVGAVVRERVEVALTAAADSATVTIAQASNDATTSRYLTPTMYDYRGLQIVVWIDTAQDATPTPDGWQRWVPGAVYKYRQVRLRLEVSSITPRNVQVSAFTWKRRRLNRKDEQQVTVTGTGGTAVTWTTTFTAAPKVTVSVETALSRFATVESVTTSGCSVRVWNDAGTEQSSGVVNVVAMGV